MHIYFVLVCWSMFACTSVCIKFMSSFSGRTSLFKVRMRMLCLLSSIIFFLLIFFWAGYVFPFKFLVQAVCLPPSSNNRHHHLPLSLPWQATATATTTIRRLKEKKEKKKKRKEKYLPQPYAVLTFQICTHTALLQLLKWTRKINE